MLKGTPRPRSHERWYIWQLSSPSATKNCARQPKSTSFEATTGGAIWTDLQVCRNAVTPSKTPDQTHIARMPSSSGHLSGIYTSFNHRDLRTPARHIYKGMPGRRGGREGGPCRGGRRGSRQSAHGDGRAASCGCPLSAAQAGPRPCRCSPRACPCTLRQSVAIGSHTPDPGPPPLCATIGGPLFCRHQARN